jgi:hypothetical protein
VGLSRATAAVDGGNPVPPTITADEKLTAEAPVGAAKLLVTRAAPKHDVAGVVRAQEGLRRTRGPRYRRVEIVGSGVGAGWRKSVYIFH